MNKKTYEKTSILKMDTTKDTFADCSGEEKLLIAVIASGIRDKDYDYYDSDAYEYHCHLLGLNPEYLKTFLFELAGIKQ